MLVMESLSDAHAALLTLVAETITPEVAALDPAGRARMTAIIDAALMDRGEGMRRQLGAFLVVIRVLPVLRYGRTFDRLDGDRRAAVLRWFESSPIALFRKGFWGLKVMVFMGYYGQEETWPEIGYSPAFDARGLVRHA
jgi:hypothetical protein